MVLIGFLIHLLIINGTTADSFVLLSSSDKARLASSPENPNVIFYLHPQPPPLSDKAHFLGGIYQHMSDDELWPILVEEALKPWNEVESSFILLELEISNQHQDIDGFHVIAIGEASVTSAASATPTIEKGSIFDCDIRIADRKTSAKSIAYTIMHEIGHCLGLGHNHHNYDAVMGYSRTNRSLYLGADDIAGLSFLYPAHTDGTKELIPCGAVGISIRAKWPIAILLLIPVCVIMITNIDSSQRFS